MRSLAPPALVLALLVLAARPAAAGLAEQCSWPPPGGPALHPESVQAEMTPVVADLDADGSPEIVVITFRDVLDDNQGRDGVLRILRGSDCSEIATNADPGCVACFGEPPCRSLEVTGEAGVLCPSCGVAVADLDGDGRLEIVALTEVMPGTPDDRARMIVFDHAGQFVRCSPPSPEPIGNVAAPALADLDADGTAEMVARNVAFSTDGPLLWAVPPDGLGPSIVADLDGDGVQEVVEGEVALRADGSLLWERPDLGVTTAAVADLDLDCRPDVVLSSRTTQALLVVDPLTGATRASAPIPAGDCPPRWDGQGGPPTLADVDGDCVPEIGIAGCRRYALFGYVAGPPEQIVLRWETPVDDGSSRFTGSAIFDLDADGTAEVLYNDQDQLRLFDAVTGAVEAALDNSTSTLIEFPVVADADGDGDAEVVVTANDHFFCCNHGVRVLHDDAVPWAPVPSLFNQHSFHVTNVLPDGRIPAGEEPSWLRYNSYRVQGPPVRSPEGPELEGVPPDATVACPPPEPPVVTARGGCGDVPEVTLEETAIGGPCGELRRTWSATDRCGRQTSQAQVLDVVDADPPVISGVPADAVVRCPDLIPSPGTPAATDACDPAPSLELNETQGSGCAGRYEIVRTWTARDACGNESVTTQRVTVVDDVAPRLRVPPDAVVDCGSDPPSSGATATDACDPAPIIRVTESREPGPCPGSEILRRTWTAEDACGNVATGTQVITIADRTAPAIDGVPPDLTVECGAVPPPASPSARDACDPAPALRFDETRTEGPCPGSATLVRTWTAEDACGNVATRTQRITVLDRTAPALGGVPGDVTVRCDAVPPPASPTATDACDPAPRVDFAERRLDGACPDEHVLERTWTARDACGNASSRVQRVTVVDDGPPVLDVPADATLECGDPIPPAAATARDACDPAPVVALEETVVPGRCAGERDIVRTWTATDRCGRTAVARQVVRIVDTTPPAIAGDRSLCLWSPNHWVACLGPEHFSPVVTDACDAAVSWRLAGCASDQPEDALGDGHFAPDCAIDELGRLCVRAERQGMKPEGRHYGVLAVAVDACGNESAPSLIGDVWIPRDQREHPDCLKIQDVATQRGQGGGSAR